MLAVFGAQAALGGLTLVFLGIAISGFGSFSPEQDPSASRPYLRAAYITLFSFGVAMLGLTLSLIWLLFGVGCLYILTLLVFPLQLVLVMGSAIYVTRVSLGKG